MNKRYTYFIVILLIIGSLFAFGRILDNEFVNFDDNEYITENNQIKSGLNIETVKWAFTAVVSSNWHPLTLLSHALDWSLFNEYAGGHHFISLLLHIVSVFLLFLFLKKITRNLWPAAFAAALFALHPLRVESVAWAAERKDVLSMFFGLTTLYAYAYYVERPKLSKYFFCIILFILGLMAKPMLVTLPFVLMLLDFWPLQRWQKELQPEKNISVKPAKHISIKIKNKSTDFDVKRKESLSSGNVSSKIGHLFLEKVPFIILAIISGIITVWAQYKAIASFPQIPFSERILNAIVSYVSYLGKTFWPVELAVFYPYQHAYASWQILGSLFVIAGISIGVIYFVKKAPFLLVGWLWYLGALIPVIGLVQVGGQAMADRYTYFPSIGIAIMLAWGIPLLFKREEIRKKILFPAGGLALVVLAFLTWQQCGYWKNSITLFSRATQVTKDNYLAFNNIGVALADKRKHQDAISYYKKAIKVYPYYDNAYYNLANAFKDQGNMEEAKNNFRKVLEINPRFVDANNNLGLILELYYKKYDEAIYHYRQEIKINPDDYKSRYNLGIILARRGELREAIEHFRKAIYLKPDFQEALRALRLALENEQH